jgi:cell division protein FtsB
MRLATLGLIALLVILQYPLWFGSGGLFAVWSLKREIAAQQGENARLHERNQVLAAEVIDLKKGVEAVEERARVELGMIKRGETFFQVIDEPKGTKPAAEARPRGTR